MFRCVQWCVVVLACVALPASAGVRPCTGAMVTGGLCTATTDVLLSYAVPQAVQADFLAAYAAAMNYQETVPCAEEAVSDRGILVAAGLGMAGCAPAQVGQEIPNPQSRSAAVDAFIRNQLADTVRQWRVQQRVEAEREAAEAQETEPEFGNGGGR